MLYCYKYNFKSAVVTHILAHTGPVEPFQSTIHQVPTLFNSHQVSPNIYYFSSIWHPYLIKDILLEWIQGRATLNDFTSNYIEGL